MKAVEHYFQAWNALDPEARLAAVRSAFAPNAEVAGHQAISDLMAAGQAKILETFPSFSFVRTSAIEQHHNRIRFNWALKAPNGAAPLSGVDFARLDDQGRLRALTGFFGETPAGL